MFLRATKRFKEGKEHRYWSIVENRRCRGKQVVQHQVLDLGETKCATSRVVRDDRGGSRGPT
jgi:hypothetical protein